MSTNQKWVIVVALLTGLLSVAMLMGEDKPEALAQKSAESWLALVDGGNYEDSWEQASAAFESQRTKEKWIGALQQARQPLGKMQSCRLASAQYSESLPKAPAGKYVAIRYQTAFEKISSATEPWSRC
jgi:hypothetical protein